MTDRKQALTELLAKIEAGDDAGLRKANRTVFSTPCQDMALQLREEHSRHAYKGSLDAAKALHEAVLPEYGAQIDLDGITVVEHRAAWPFDPHHGENDIPARAWLIAIIKALIAEETQ